MKNEAATDAGRAAVTLNKTEFYSSLNLERGLYAVTKEVLSGECLTLQMDYIKTTKNPKTMNSKSWIQRLTEIQNLMYFMTSKNYVLSQATINRDVIDKNTPLKWIINWRKQRSLTR